MDDLVALQKERQKIARPDQVTFNADRTPATETYSRARLDELDKADRKIGKLTAALDKAIDTGDLADLYNLGKSDQ